jgi:hypothetical protein
VDVVRYTPEITEGRAEHRRAVRELADFLVAEYGSSSGGAAYLVRGFVVCTDLNGCWEEQFPPRVEWGVESFGTAGAAFHIPSAFHLYISLGDFSAAARIAERHIDAFDTPNLRGWRDAVRGFVAPPGRAAELFSSASFALAEDLQPVSPNLVWTSANATLWSKYFAALSDVARIALDPVRASELVRSAIEKLAGTDEGWTNHSVSQLRVVINVLSEALEGRSPALPRRPSGDLALTLRFDPASDDRVSYVNCVERLREAFALLQTDPVRASIEAPLRDALSLLAHAGQLGKEVIDLLAAPIQRAVHNAMFGTVKTDIYRVLEGITDEEVLQHILRRLLQAARPEYAQVRHGQLEYGKDIAVVESTGGQRVLRCYQAKIGPISTANWGKLRSQIDEIFLMDVGALQLGGPIDSKEAVVVCNGHITPHYEEFVKNWCQEQSRVFGRTIVFQHIDMLVNWIVDNRLVSELRAMCRDLGLAWPDAS